MPRGLKWALAVRPAPFQESRCARDKPSGLMVLKRCSCHRERDFEVIFQWAEMWDFSEIKGRKLSLYPSIMTLLSPHSDTRNVSD